MHGVALHEAVAGGHSTFAAVCGAAKPIHIKTSLKILQKFCARDKQEAPPTAPDTGGVWVCRVVMLLRLIMMRVGWAYMMSGAEAVMNAGTEKNKQNKHTWKIM